MKNKKIYKIFTILVVLSVVMSLLCVNVAAFEREENYDDIPGEHVSGGNIYGQDYVLINCGDIASDFNTAPNLSGGMFASITNLNSFLNSVDSGSFTSPNGLYTYTSLDSLKYVEFLFFDPYSNDQIRRLGSPMEYGLYNNYACLSNTLSVVEILGRYKCFVDLGLADYYGSCGIHAFIIAVLYFNDCSPFDEVNSLKDDIQALEVTVQGQEAQISSITKIANSRASKITELEGDIQELEGVVEEKNRLISLLEYDIDSLTEDIRDYVHIIEDQKFLIFELENSDMLDNLFTGITDSILTLVRGVSDLGYTTSSGISITIGSLFVVAILGVVVLFIIKLIRGY